MKIKKIVVGGLESNCYVLQSKKIGLIIDPGDEAQKIIDAAQEIEIKLILATHRHFDHITALQRVKKVVKADAAIHPLDWVDGFDLKLNDGQVIELVMRRLGSSKRRGIHRAAAAFWLGLIYFPEIHFFQMALVIQCFRVVMNERFSAAYEKN